MDASKLLEFKKYVTLYGPSIRECIDCSSGGGVGPTGPTGPNSGSIGPTGPGVAEGGTTGQILAKASDTNYHTVWQDNTPTFVGTTGEPTGFPNRTASTISFNSSLRSFRIQPSGSYFEVYVRGTLFVKSSAETVVVPNTSGIYYISYNTSGALQVSTTFFELESVAPVAYVYWNADDYQAYYFGDERHGVTMDWATHEYSHLTRGAQYASGLSIGNYTTTGLGDSDTNVRFTIGNGTIFDEDLQIDIEHSLTPAPNTFQQTLNNGAAQLPIFYMTGGGVWKRSTPTVNPLLMGLSRPYYNKLTGALWSLAQVDNGQFFAMWILATNNLNYPVLAIMGQRQDSSESLARSNNQWSSLVLTNMPSLEFRVLYRLVYQVRDAYTNTTKAALRDVLDLRREGLEMLGTTANDHGVLAGLNDDDHAQYVHIENARTITAQHTFKSTTHFSSIHVSSLGIQSMSTLGAPVPSQWKALYYNPTLGMYGYVP